MISKRLALKGLAGTLIAGTLSLTSISSASAGRAYLGGIDLWRYCQEKFGPTATAKLPREWAKYIPGIQHDPYSWRCVGSKFHMPLFPPAQATYDPAHQFLVRRVPVDFDEACRMQYGSDAKAELMRQWDPYAWQCYRDLPDGGYYA